jgi:hypothetical protein
MSEQQRDDYDQDTLDQIEMDRIEGILEQRDWEQDHDDS